MFLWVEVLNRALAWQDRDNAADDLAVEVGDSVMSHRRRYTVNTTRETVIDLLALDTMNPRAVLYHVTEIRDQIAQLPEIAGDGHMSDLARAVLQLHTDIAVQRPEELAPEAFLSYAQRLMRLSDVITNTYMR